MFDYADATAFSNLERELIYLLTGDEKGGGLYRGLMSAPTMELVQFTRGQIVAYENVRDTMKKIAARMNQDDDKDTRQFGRVN